MNDHKRKSSFVDNIAAIILCFLVVVGGIGTFGIVQMRRVSAMKAEQRAMALRAEMLAVKAAEEAAELESQAKATTDEAMGDLKDADGEEENQKAAK